MTDNKYFEERSASYNRNPQLKSYASDLLCWHIWKLAFNAGAEYERKKNIISADGYSVHGE